MRDALRIAQQVAELVEQTLAPLLLAMTAWRPEFRVIVLEAVGHRALELASEMRREREMPAMTS